MTELLTAAQMRAIEQAAIDSGEVTSLELMERAGAGVVEAIFEWRPELTEGDRRAVVLCGPGNNGGDGFVVARLLKQRGWTVEVFLYGDEAKLPPDAAENCRRWRKLGVVERLVDTDFDGRFNYSCDFEGATEDIVVDALFGIGLNRAFTDLAHLQMELNTIQSFSQRGLNYPTVVSIDIPSGLCADSGRDLADEQPADFGIMANLTVTFHAEKLGHVLAGGALQSGKLTIVDLGIDHVLVRDALIAHHDLPKGGRGLGRRVAIHAEPFLHLDKYGARHKYSHGHALIISGGMAKTGAARLAARGALRIGAGLVTVASPPNALMENAAHLTAIMLRKMKGADGLADILTDERINAVVIGPGCGVGKETRGLVEAALEIPSAPDSIRGLDRQRAAARGPASSAGQRQTRTVVLDADALTSYADDPATLFTAIKASPCSVILTPHGGEFARLFPYIAAKLAETPTKGPAYSKVDATREAASHSGATVLYKGPDTVIAAPNGHCSIAAAVYERAAPWLATAGSGDVLAGMIAGLAARGVHDPAATAAWLHQECGRHLGPGLIAEDIPEAIPSVLKQILKWEPPSET